jgi:hypothetical protein
MSGKSILITIDDEGVLVEGLGFQGPGCLAEVAQVSRRLGVQGELEKKPEYHQFRSGRSGRELALDQNPDLSSS